MEGLIFEGDYNSNRKSADADLIESFCIYWLMNQIHFTVKAGQVYPPRLHQ